MSSDLLGEQLDYYRARAGEYDDWWFRRGRYDRGAELNERWFKEAAAVRCALHEFVGPQPVDRALDLAAGTGLWTAQLLRLAHHVTALDAAPEVLEVNRERNLKDAARLTLQVSDLFAWEPETQYDLANAAFWLSHVPPEQRSPFIAKLAAAVRPGGKVFLVDSLFTPTSTAQDHILNPAGQHWQTRRLADGREFRVVKVFLDPVELAGEFVRHGFTARGHSSGEFFLQLTATRS